MYLACRIGISIKPALFLSAFAIVKIRQTLLPALLTLMLLLSQQLGYLHALSHLSDGSDNPLHSKQVPVEKACEQCLAFAQLDAAAPVALDLPLVHVAVYPLPEVRSPQQLALAFLSVFHSRGPPATL